MIWLWARELSRVGSKVNKIFRLRVRPHDVVNFGARYE